MVDLIRKTSAIAIRRGECRVFLKEKLNEQKNNPAPDKSGTGLKKNIELSSLLYVISGSTSTLTFPFKAREIMQLSSAFSTSFSSIR
ncbi:hypothetical protein GCM10009001_23800 [Virgibacillus siamensis]|uniref:Uncharacterized protein n=1 Tax=Virgibacillus siamensis TaxID=480071 RepID=A0ABP3RBJ0_9BACI